MKPAWNQYIRYAIIMTLLIASLLLFETIRLKNTGFETKTLWDWMELLIIPIFLTIGAFILNYSERQIERERAKEQSRMEQERIEERARREENLADERALFEQRRTEKSAK